MLSRGSALEIAAIREGKDPMLYREREAYLVALHEAVEGVEEGGAAAAPTPAEGQESAGAASAKQIRRG